MKSTELTQVISEHDLLEKAIRLAVTAHAGQMRKDGDIPYITHPIAVALMLAKTGFSDEIIAAGLVHDVVEDTLVTAEELRHELGDAVADIIASVTNDDTLSWDEKKLKYIETVRAGNEGAKAVSVADKIHNAESLLTAYEKKGSAIWKKFNAPREKKLWFEEKMLAMLQESWKHPLVEVYAVLVEKMKMLVD